MADRRTVHQIVFQLIRQEHYASARTLMFKNCTDDRRFVDRVIGFYIERGERKWLTGYEDFCRAYELLPLKPSRKARESLLAAFVKTGFHNHAARLAEGLRRTLTSDEMRTLVAKYTGGACQSDETEKVLLALADHTGGRTLNEECRAEIAKMHKRWENDIF